MDVSLFDFDLPNERIALRPAEQRDAARMLVVRPDAETELDDRIIGDLPGLLRAGDVLVVNDTRVIPAQLLGVRTGRGDSQPKIEVTLHKRVDARTWLAFAKPGKKLAAGDALQFATLVATVLQKNDGGEVVLQFAASGPELDRAIASHGVMPLPPYIAGKRAADERDRADYQTMFAAREGAVAAPTAGLHFTEDLIARLDMRGISLARVTLHVGAGTFLPMKAQDTRDHRMHAEWGSISAETAERLQGARRAGGRVIAVGTTALRLLETSARENGAVAAWSGDTDIFITPGYEFRAVDALLTNFHLPRSTLFMLVSAFCGLERMQRAYAHAISSGYRFYSYGDASLLFPDPR